MHLSLRNMGYVHGPMLRDDEIAECKASALLHNTVRPRGNEQYNLVHNLSLQLGEKRLNCIDCREHTDVVFATEDSKVLQVWSTNYPGKIPRPQEVELGTGEWNTLQKNSDFLKVKVLLHPTPVNTVSFMQERILFTGSRNGLVRMYDSVYDLMDTWLENMQNITDIHHNLRFDQFAVTSETVIRRSGNLRLFGANIFSFFRKGPIHQFFRHNNPTETLRFDSTAMMLAIVDTEGLIHVFDTRSGEPIKSFLCGSSGEKKRVEFSPDSRFIAAKHRGALIVYEIGSGRRYAELPSSVLSNYDFEFAYNALGNRIAIGGSDGLLKIWDVSVRSLQPKSWEFSVDGPVRRIRSSRGSIFNCVI